MATSSKQKRMRRKGMHPLIERIIKEAQKVSKRIVLPEAEDERILRAARQATDEGVCRIILCGNEDKIIRKADELNISLKDMKICDVPSHPHLQDYIEQYYQNRKLRGEPRSEAEKVIKDPLFFAAMMAKNDEADGVVAGAANTTARVLRAVIRIIKPHPDIHTISSFFLMLLPQQEYGDEGVLLYADCASVISPDSTQLSEIAVTSADSYRFLVGGEPRVAMLPFSTHGSSHHPCLDKVVKATRYAQKIRPDILVDGEIQVDTALVPDIAGKKAPHSPVAGKANVLIFPDLNSGNIAYKLTERLAGARAVGPVLQGANLPMNDLSRGCSTRDIFLVMAITAIQAQK